MTPGVVRRSLSPSAALKGSLFVLATSLATSLFAGSAALAQVSDDVVRIGVLSDMAGNLASLSGKGSVVAAQMAVEDFGGTVLGKKIEVISADHQNKSDVGSQIANKWFDIESVDMIVDAPNSSVALAVQEIAQGEEPRVHCVCRRHGGVDRQGVLADRYPLDVGHLCGRGLDRPRDCRGRRQVLVFPHRRLRVRPRDGGRRHARRARARRQSRELGTASDSTSPTSRRFCCRPRLPART